jgi:hypothetical protein
MNLETHITLNTTSTVINHFSLCEVLFLSNSTLFKSCVEVYFTLHFWRLTSSFALQLLVHKHWALTIFLCKVVTNFSLNCDTVLDDLILHWCFVLQFKLHRRFLQWLLTDLQWLFLQAILLFTSSSFKFLNV